LCSPAQVLLAGAPPPWGGRSLGRPARRSTVPGGSSCHSGEAPAHCPPAAPAPGGRAVQSAARDPSPRRVRGCALRAPARSCLLPLAEVRHSCSGWPCRPASRLKTRPAVHVSNAPLRNRRLQRRARPRPEQPRRGAAVPAVPMGLVRRVLAVRPWQGWRRGHPRGAYRPHPVSACDLMCRSACDLMCRSSGELSASPSGWSPFGRQPPSRQTEG